LPGFGTAGQEKLRQSRVLLVGAGGLGCPAAQYLAAAGVGVIGIADYDVVTVGNLHRQVLFSPHDIGLLKAEVVCLKLRLQNPDVTFSALVKKITTANVLETIAGYDIIVDCTDNFETKYVLNDACVLSGKPLVYGAIYQYEGQVAVWNVQQSDGTYSPHYRDVFPEVNSSAVPNCAEGGVLPTLAGIIGCMQANEVIKYIINTGDLLAGKLLLLDVRTMQSRLIKTGTSSRQKITALPPEELVLQLSASALQEALRENKCILIDVRELPEREAFHIGGQHIPLKNLLLEMRTPAPQVITVFYCESGSRSAEAAKIAQKLFPEYRFYSLEGGLKRWREITED
jgi:adenylyltransferase/sulfurtransferase